LIPNPTRAVLSSMKKNGVQTLLMGGQACVLYGAAEFSKDVDFAVLAEAANLALLRNALDELEARVITVPPFEAAYLERGHSVHFRCGRADVEDLRVDVMSKMRGVDDFAQLWERRTVVEVALNEELDVLSVPDLIRAKKTQRTKDWPMIERLVVENYFANRENPTPQRIQFWQDEARTPAILLAVARQFPESKSNREAALLASEGADENTIEAALKREEEREREADKIYWAPLKRELEELRRVKQDSKHSE